MHTHSFKKLLTIIIGILLGAHAVFSMDSLNVEEGSYAAAALAKDDVPACAAIKGTYDVIAPDYKSVSLIHGAIAWETGFIRRLYDLGDPASPTVRLVRALFCRVPSSTSASDFGVAEELCAQDDQVIITSVAQIVCSCSDEKLEEPLKQLLNDNTLKEFQGNDEDIATVLKQLFDEQSPEKTQYLPHTIEMIFLAFVYKKYGYDRQMLESFYKELAKKFLEKEERLFVNPRAATIIDRFLNAFGLDWENVVQVLRMKPGGEQFVSKIEALPHDWAQWNYHAMRPRDAQSKLENLLWRGTLKKHYEDIVFCATQLYRYPQPNTYRKLTFTWHKKEKAVTVSCRDCMDNALRNLIRLYAYNPRTQMLEVAQLEKYGFKPHERLINFIETYSNPYEDDTPNAHVMWLKKVTGNINDAAYEQHNRLQLTSSRHNFFTVLNYLLGLKLSEGCQKDLPKLHGFSYTLSGQGELQMYVESACPLMNNLKALDFSECESLELVVADLIGRRTIAKNYEIKQACLFALPLERSEVLELLESSDEESIKQVRLRALVAMLNQDPKLSDIKDEKKKSTLYQNIMQYAKNLDQQHAVKIYTQLQACSDNDIDQQAKNALHKIKQSQPTAPNEKKETLLKRKNEPAVANEEELKLPEEPKVKEELKEEQQPWNASVEATRDVESENTGLVIQTEVLGTNTTPEKGTPLAVETGKEEFEEKRQAEAATVNTEQEREREGADTQQTRPVIEESVVHAVVPVVEIVQRQQTPQQESSEQKTQANEPVLENVLVPEEDEMVVGRELGAQQRLSAKKDEPKLENALGPVNKKEPTTPSVQTLSFKPPVIGLSGNEQSEISKAKDKKEPLKVTDQTLQFNLGLKGNQEGFLKPLAPQEVENSTDKREKNNQPIFLQQVSKQAQIPTFSGEKPKIIAKQPEPKFTSLLSEGSEKKKPQEEEQTVHAQQPQEQINTILEEIKKLTDAKSGDLDKLGNADEKSKTKRKECFKTAVMYAFKSFLEKPEHVSTLKRNETTVLIQPSSSKSPSSTIQKTETPTQLFSKKPAEKSLKPAEKSLEEQIKEFMEEYGSK